MKMDRETYLKLADAHWQGRLEVSMDGIWIPSSYLPGIEDKLDHYRIRPVEVPKPPSETPETDELVAGTPEGECRNRIWGKAIDKCRELEKQRNHARSRLNFLESKGLTVGLLKSADCPEGRLAYVIEEGSELCNLDTVNRLIDAEIAQKKLSNALRAYMETIPAGTAKQMAVRWLTLDALNKYGLPPDGQSGAGA